MPKFKTIGIFGGMGPASSWYFEKLLLKENKTAHIDQDHPPFIHYANTQVPNRIAALNKKGESPVAEMVKTFETLKTSGADFGVMICNTAHAYWKEIKDKTDFPIIHLIEETSKNFHKQYPGKNKVGLLSTTDTMKRRLYHDFFEKIGIEIVGPPESDQKEIDRAIFDEKIGIKSTGVEISQEAKEILIRTGKRLALTTGVSTIIDGCTEISMALGEEQYDGFDTIDPLVCVARTCLELAGIKS